MAPAPPKGRKATQGPDQKTPDAPPAGGDADQYQQIVPVRRANNGD
jgi:hypothetical protein